LQRQIQPGSIDTWKIKNVEVDAITVTNGTYEGIIERSELSYFRLEEDLTRRFKPGEHIKAMVLAVPASGPLVLGVKQIEAPQWKKFVREHRTGEKLYGRVLRVHHKEGALVQIEHTGGVIGRIPPDESVDVGPGDVYLMAGDRVSAVLIDFDQDHQCAVLSLQRLIQTHDPWKSGSTISIGELAGEELQLFSFRLGLYGQHSFDAAIRRLKSRGIRTIFFCDDDEEVCRTYQQSYEFAGFQVITARGGEKGIEIANTRDFDLAIVDLHMKDKDGCEVAQAIRQAKNCPLILVSGINNYHKHGYGEKLQRFGLLNAILRKPFTINDIADKLEKITASSDTEANALSILDFLSQTIKETFRLEDTLASLLETIRAHTKADTVCVFETPIIDPKVSLVARCGDFPADFDKETITRSPVKDVIVETHNLNQFDIPETERLPGNYFTNLCQIYPCRAIMARALRISGDKRFGLFIMSKNPKREWKNLRLSVSAMAEMVATAIERKRLEERFVSHQHFYTLGQISSSLIHELKNEEQIVSNSIQQLSRLADNVSRSDEPLSYDDELFQAGFHSAVDTLVKHTERIGRIQNLFVTFRHRQEVEKVNINQHLELLCDTLQPYAREQGVTLMYRAGSPEGLWVQVNLTFLNQILTNLVMNSIEQTRRIRPDNGKIEVFYEADEVNRLLRIKVRDNGPGIHEAHRDRIFELLFTSKPKGMGMGLYISRAFARAIHGELRIEYTCRFDGTVMVIELPLTQGDKPCTNFSRN